MQVLRPFEEIPLINGVVVIQLKCWVRANWRDAAINDFQNIGEHFLLWLCYMDVYLRFGVD